jgi:Domain of unknown function (DUF6378)
MAGGSQGATFYDRKQMDRQKILDDASALINGDRAKAYGDALDNHRRIAAGWSVILGKEVKPHEVALCMGWVKMARLVVSEDHADSYIDGAAYFALAGEIQQRDSEERKSAARTSGHVADGSV